DGPATIGPTPDTCSQRRLRIRSNGFPELHGVGTTTAPTSTASHVVGVSRCRPSCFLNAIQSLRSGQRREAMGRTAIHIKLRVVRRVVCEANNISGSAATALMNQ